MQFNFMQLESYDSYDLLRTHLIELYTVPISNTNFKLWMRERLINRSIAGDTSFLLINMILMLNDM